MFDGWLDRFFEAYYRQRPVNATFIGVHTYDDRLPDLSEAGQAELLFSARALREELRRLPNEPLTLEQRMDRELADGFLEIQSWEAQSPHFAWGNPSLYTGEAVFGLLSLLLRPFAPLSERLDHAAERLSAVPRFLEDATQALHDAPHAWCLRARRECAGAALLLDGGLGQPRLQRAASLAREAFIRFDAFLETDLPPKPTHQYACGPETFDLLLRRAHFLDVDVNELERLALERITVRTHSAESGSRPERYVERYAELWRAARDLAEQADLLTFPDWPVQYVEQPAWVRDAAPYLYFLPYRSPAPFDSAPAVEYFVPPNADDSTIKLNHVVHHGSLGHHVQNWHAIRAQSRIGQIAAVDCASRIAMLCGGTMAEGWACYATDLAAETGFLTPAECAAQEHSHVRMAARCVVDIRLHQARMSLEEAAAFYVAHVGMSAHAALAEAVKNSLFPGAACMYFAGWDAIRQLRREFHDAGRLSLRQFHDRLLSFGSVPVTLAGRALRKSAEYHRP